NATRMPAQTQSNHPKASQTKKQSPCDIPPHTRVARHRQTACCDAVDCRTSPANARDRRADQQNQILMQINCLQKKSAPAEAPICAKSPHKAPQQNNKHSPTLAVICTNPDSDT
ncbi:hypothetical protein, partial [Paraburkholderia caribensis]